MNDSTILMCICPGYIGEFTTVGELRKKFEKNFQYQGWARGFGTIENCIKAWYRVVE